MDTCKLAPTRDDLSPAYIRIALHERQCTRDALTSSLAALARPFWARCKLRGWSGLMRYFGSYVGLVAGDEPSCPHATNNWHFISLKSSSRSTQVAVCQLCDGDPL